MRGYWSLFPCTGGEQCVSTRAFIDSGAGGVFLDVNLVNKLWIPVVPKKFPHCVTTLGVNSLVDCLISQGSIPLYVKVGALDHEILTFNVILSPRHPVILGFPWLCKHNQPIDWSAGKITTWCAVCLVHCLQMGWYVMRCLFMRYRQTIQCPYPTQSFQICSLKKGFSLTSSL